MPSEQPSMNWEHRLYQPAFVGGWSVEVRNPMTNNWQRSGFDPHWPDGNLDVAREWVRLANEEQCERNGTAAASLAGA